MCAAKVVVFFWISCLATSLFGSVGYCQSLEDYYGEWTTYRYRDQNGFTRVDLSLSGDQYVQNLMHVLFLPLFPSEGIDFIIYSSPTSSRAEEDQEGRRVWHANATIRKVEMRFNSLREIIERNAISFCGLRDWEPGVYKDVTGRLCQNSESSEEDPDEIQYPRAGDPHKLVFSGDPRDRIFSDLGADQVDGEESDLNEIVVDWTHPLFRKEP